MGVPKVPVSNNNLQEELELSLVVLVPGVLSNGVGVFGRFARVQPKI
jgi:hypothetical protein